MNIPTNVPTPEAVNDGVDAALVEYLCQDHIPGQVNTLTKHLSPEELGEIAERLRARVKDEWGSLTPSMRTTLRIRAAIVERARDWFVSMRKRRPRTGVM